MIEQNAPLQVVEVEGAEPIEGVGILFYPPYLLGNNCETVIDAGPMVRGIAEKIKRGSIITMPSTRDHLGYLFWDFRIEGGDPGQVEIRRNDE